MPTVRVHAHDKVVAHGSGLAQLIRVAIMHHVVAAERAGRSVPGLRRPGTRWPVGSEGAQLIPSVLGTLKEPPRRTAPQPLGLGFAWSRELSSPHHGSLGPGPEAASAVGVQLCPGARSADPRAGAHTGMAPS